MAEPSGPEASTYKAKRYPGFGWKLLVNGVPEGDELGPWWPSRRHVMAEADRRAVSRG